MTDKPQVCEHPLLQRVHVTTESVRTLELTPPHAVRTETAAYRKAHHFLVVEQNSPCLVCGITNSTLSDPVANVFGAVGMETHHSPIERSLLNAVDPLKVHQRFPIVFDQATLEVWIDSPGNLLVFCDVHHRSLKQGIHHLSTPDFSVLPYLKNHYIIATDAADVVADCATDSSIEKKDSL